MLRRGANQMSKASGENEEVKSLLYQSVVHVCGGGITVHYNNDGNDRRLTRVDDDDDGDDDSNHDNGSNKEMSSCSLPYGEGQVAEERSCTSTNGGDDISSDSSISLWRENLKSLVLKSISKTNGSKKSKSEGIKNGTESDKNNNNNGADGIGKGHDIETRIATSIYHRYRTYSHSERCKDKKKKKKKKKDARKKEKKKRRVDADGVGVGPQSVIKEDIATLNIISDLGLERTIYSPHELASLLVKDMEDQLWERRTRNNEHNTDHCLLVDRVNNETSIMMIQADQSGIICIVTKERFRYLRENDRYPCSHCIKWCKGQKGLWWHEQMFHGLDHSTAAAAASALTSSSSDSKALVIYNRDIDETATVDKILEVKKEKNEQDPYFDSIKIGDLKEFKKFIQHNHNQNYNQSLKYDPKSHLDKNGASALHWAAGCGHIDIVKYLINECKSPPDQIQKGKRSFHGRTPLHWSARNGHLDVVRYLIEHCHGVDIDARTIDGTTAFCWASWQGHLHVMKYLHEKGANVKSVNSFGCNAILWSAQSSQSGLDAIQFLEKIGVEIQMINSNGHGILHKSAQRGKRDVCDWIFKLLEHMSTVDRFHERDQQQISLLSMIAPDAENCCPSDLAGMEGHNDLAQWLVNQEKNICLRALTEATCSNQCKPPWLEEALHDVKHLANRTCLDDIWESGAAVKKIASFIEKEFTCYKI